MRWLLLLFLSCPAFATVWIHDGAAPPTGTEVATCATNLEADHDVLAKAARVISFLSFDHPIQKRALEKAANLRAIYFLVHWSAGFQVSTDPERYRPESPNFAIKYGQRRSRFNLFTPKVDPADPFARFDVDDQFVDYLPRREGKLDREIDPVYANDKLREIFKRYQQFSEPGIWEALPSGQKGTAIFDMIMGAMVPWRTFEKEVLGRRTIPELHLVFPEDFLPQIRRLFSKEDAASLSQMVDSLVDERVFAQVLGQVDQIYPLLLQRRRDFGIRLYAKPDDNWSKVDFVSSPERIRHDDLAGLKAWLVRDTPARRSLRLALSRVIGQEVAPEDVTTGLEISPVASKPFSLPQLRGELDALERRSSAFSADQWGDQVGELAQNFTLLSAAMSVRPDGEAFKNIRTAGETILRTPNAVLKPTDLTPLMFQLVSWSKDLEFENAKLGPLLEALELNQKLINEAVRMMTARLHEMAANGQPSRTEQMQQMGLTQKVQHLQQMQVVMAQAHQAGDLRWKVNAQTLQNIGTLQLISASFASSRLVHSSEPDLSTAESFRQALTALFKTMQWPLPLGI